MDKNENKLIALRDQKWAEYNDKIGEIQNVAFKMQRGEELNAIEKELVRQVLFVFIAEIYWRRNH